MVLGRSRSFRITGATALATALLGTVVTLLLGLRLPDAVALSRWQTESYFQNSLRLMADGRSWLLALALLLGLLAVCLDGLSGRGKQDGRHRIGSLLVISCALVALFADNLMTLAIAWATLDIVVYFWLAFARGENRAEAEFSLSLLAIALVLAAALVGAEAGVPAALNGGKMPTQGVLFLVMAAILHLNLYPVHLSARRIVQSSQVEIECITRLAVLAVAVNLLGALTSEAQMLPLRGWMTMAALVAGLVGGWRWYAASVPREQITHLLLAQAGMIMLTFLWGDNWAVPGVIAQGLSVLLAVPVFLLYRGNVASDRRWTSIPVLAALVLGGIRLTVGFVGVLTLYTGLLQAGIWALTLPVVVVIQALLMAGGLRLALFSGQGPPKEAPFANVGYKLGLTIPAMAGVLLGLAPDKLGAMVGVVDLPGWTGITTPGGFTALGSALLAGGMGAGLWAFREQLDCRGATIPRLALASTVELRWLHGSVWTVYRGIARTMRAAALVLEGQGGVLWALVLVISVWLAVGR